MAVPFVLLQLASVCERVRSDDNFIKIVNELRPSEAASRRSGGQASPSTAAEPPLDPKLAASLDAMFGVSVGMPAPITDIVTVFKGDPVPDGFVKVRACFALLAFQRCSMLGANLTFVREVITQAAPNLSQQCSFDLIQ